MLEAAGFRGAQSPGWSLRVATAGVPLLPTSLGGSWRTMWFSGGLLLAQKSPHHSRGSVGWAALWLSADITWLRACSSSPSLGGSRVTSRCLTPVIVPGAQHATGMLSQEGPAGGTAASRHSCRVEGFLLSPLSGCSLPRPSPNSSWDSLPFLTRRLLSQACGRIQSSRKHAEVCLLAALPLGQAPAGMQLLADVA